MSVMGWNNGVSLDLIGQRDVQAVLVLMYARARAAAIRECAVEEMALEPQFLHDKGVTDVQLGALIGAGYVETRAKPGGPEGRSPAAPPEGGPPGPAGACVVLTPAGMVLAAGLLGTAPGPRETPRYDRFKRAFSFQGVVVKQFKRKAPNQETILLAFEEQGWPEEIDNPLPPDEFTAPAVQLHDTLKSLTNDQDPCTLGFLMTSGGTRVRWQVIG
jgi:hypothetical protein